MRKRIVISILFCTLIFSGANAQNWIWARAADGTGGLQEGNAVCADKSGNSYGTGFFPGDTMIFGTHLLINTTPGTENVFIVKYDTNGNAVWATNAGGDSQGNSISADDSGNVYVTGIFHNASITFGTTTLLNSGSGTNDIFLVKYDVSGNVIWAKESGGVANDMSTSVKTDRLGNIFLTGYFGNPSASFGPFTLNNSAGSDIFLVKYNAAGNVVWARSSTGAQYDLSYCVTVDSTGNIYISGLFESPVITFGAITLTISPAFGNVFLVKYDTNGNSIWARSSGGSGVGYGSSISAGPFGEIFLGGYFGGPDISFGSTTLTNYSNASSDAFLASYDTSGIMHWVKGFGGSANEVGWSVAADTSGNVYFSGSYNSSSVIFDNDTIFNPGPPFLDPMFLVKYDQYGNLHCVSTLVSGGDDQDPIATDPAGNLYLVGDFMANPFIVGSDSLPLNTGFENFFIAKYNCQCTNLGISGHDTACAGGSLSLGINLNGATYLWSTGDTTSSITVFPTAPTVYSVIVSSSTCIDTLFENVSLDSVTVTNVNVISDVNCYGAHTGSASVTANGISPYTYHWSPTGGINSVGTGLGSGTYTCTITDDNGCIATPTVTITQPSAISISSSTIPVVCLTPGSATASATGGTGTLTYSWMPSGQTTQTISGLSVGTYTVGVTDANGCLSYHTVTISQQDSVLVATTSSTLSACSVDNGTATVSVSGGTLPYSYNWSPVTGSGSSVTGLAAGTYTVTATDSNGCVIAQTLIISDPPPPSVSTGNDTTITLGGSAQLSATGSTNYTWSPTTGLSCSNCQNPVATPTVTTIYCVSVTDTSGCTNTDCQKVTVNDECEIYIPNAFSPNGDGQNDFECVRSNCIQSMHFTIYDRWGEKVFESSDQSSCWDGMYRGVKLEDAVFNYTLDAVLLNGTNMRKSGNISLVK